MVKLSKKQFAEWLGYDSNDIDDVIQLVNISDSDGVYTMLQDMGKDDMAEIVEAIYFEYGSLKEAINACKEDLGLTESKCMNENIKTKKIKLSEVRELVKSIIKENKQQYQTYHNSFTDAASEARELAEKRGYIIDEDDWQTQVALGGKYGRSRPEVGKTHTFTVGLIKDDKPQRKALTFTVYGMESGRFELVAYIN